MLLSIKFVPFVDFRYGGLRSNLLCVLTQAHFSHIAMSAVQLVSFPTLMVAWDGAKMSSCTGRRSVLPAIAMLSVRTSRTRQYADWRKWILVWRNRVRSIHALMLAGNFTSTVRIGGEGRAAVVMYSVSAMHNMFDLSFWPICGYADNSI